MQQRYKELVAKVRQYFLKEQEKKTLMSRFIPTKVFAPQYWIWQKEGVLRGMGWGAFFSIAPVPMQSLFATLCCVWKKGNIPLAVLCSWLSPPGSLFVIIPMQWYLGFRIQVALKIGNSGLSYHRVKTLLAEEKWHGLIKLAEGGNPWWMVTEFLIGCLLSCTILGLVTYGLTWLIWEASVGIKRLCHRPKKPQA